MHRLLRKAFFGRFEVPWNWPVAGEAEKWERSRFKNPGGGQLVGLWGLAELDAIGTPVLAYPMDKAAKGFWLRQGHADLFRQSGFHVRVFDANGFGESESVSFDYPADVLSADLCAQALNPELSAGLVGASFGAGWGLCSMARTGNPFRGAVLEAAFPTSPDFWRHYPFAYATLRVSQLIWPSLEGKLRPEHEATKIIGRPSVLLVYGVHDKFTPPEHGQRLLNAFGTAAQAELCVLAGVDHTFAYRDARDEYVSRVIPFLTNALQSSATAQNPRPNLSPRPTAFGGG